VFVRDVGVHQCCMSLQLRLPRVCNWKGCLWAVRKVQRRWGEWWKVVRHSGDIGEEG